jgi:hypothetical protein
VKSNNIYGYEAHINIYNHKFILEIKRDQGRFDVRTRKEPLWKAYVGVCWSPVSLCLILLHVPEKSCFRGSRDRVLDFECSIEWPGRAKFDQVCVSLLGEESNSIKLNGPSRFVWSQKQNKENNAKRGCWLSKLYRLFCFAFSVLPLIVFFYHIAYHVKNISNIFLPIIRKFP